MSKKPVLLCIMDGFGWTPNETYGNAVVAAKKPYLDALMAKYPMTTIEASGMAVGLPDGQMGNSEVGHTNMGAGRIVYQQLTLITKSIRDGEMLTDSYYTGEPVQISLRYFDFPQELQVKIYPLKEDAPRFLERWPQMKDGCACELYGVGVKNLVW